MQLDSPRQYLRLAVVVDSAGTFGAGLCAIHCALLPALLVLFPAVDGYVLGAPEVEYAYVALAAVLALFSLCWGYRRHHNCWPIAILTPGLLAVSAGLLVTTLHDDVVLHAIVMTIGGGLIATAHLMNLRLVRGPGDDTACAHKHDA